MASFRAAFEQPMGEQTSSGIDEPMIIDVPSTGPAPHPHLPLQQNQNIVRRESGHTVADGRARSKPLKSVPVNASEEMSMDGVTKGAGQIQGRQTRSEKRTDRSDPLTQSFFLLATMVVMLATARFAVPRIVEEIRYAWHRGELRAEYENGVDGLKNVSLDTLSDAYQMVTATVGPSVVHIDVQRRKDSDLDGFSALMRRNHETPSDQGSGVIVDEEGFILTNRHVIADGDDITVTLSDGRRVPATVIGSDMLTDLAVLKVESDRLIALPWGDSDRCRVGSPVWAVGSPFGLDRTVTFGILSGKHRVVGTVSQHGAQKQYQDFMQSDVAVNPGNSGGPLVDARGTLVGINTAIVGDTYRGVSFSIPSNVAREIYQRLRENGRVDRGWLGVQLAELDPEDVQGDDLRVKGALVEFVTASDSPAGMAGLRSGDIIREVDGKVVSDVSHLMRLIGNAARGETVVLQVTRRGNSLQLPVILGTRPAQLR
ncbi:MAG: trypsin-like peptidase domain-containing protein [Planctomycetota bacterium]